MGVNNHKGELGRFSPPSVKYNFTVSCPEEE